MSWSEVHLPWIAKAKFCLECLGQYQIEPKERLDDPIIRIVIILNYQSNRRENSKEHIRI